MNIGGEPAELRFTITIKRAATGEEETHELIGHIEPEANKEPDDGRNDDTQHSGA